MSKEQIKRTKSISNCFRCGWRTPLNNGVEGCVLGMKTKEEIRKNGYNNCQCERYVTDIVLRNHIINTINDYDTNAFDFEANNKN